MIEALGWVCTALVLIGFIVNARGQFLAALVWWIIGDIGWIVYDIYIHNISHLVLGIIIIAINIYGIRRYQKTNKCIKQ
jgi:hypothetical protein